MMKAKPQQQDQVPPFGSGKIIKPAATGKEREEALKTIFELSRRASQRAKELGLTEEDIARFINEP
jgi:hypothetical protein